MIASHLKKTLGLAALCFAGPLLAAGPLDGIYQVGTGEEWLSIHQTGNHLIVGRFFKTTGTNTVHMANGQDYTTSTGARWYLLSGDLAPDATSLNITGDSNLGACTSTYRLDFGASQIWMEWVAESTTPAGIEKGIDCPSDYRAATVNGTYRKVTKIY